MVNKQHNHPRLVNGKDMWIIVFSFTILIDWHSLGVWMSINYPGKFHTYSMDPVRFQQRWWPINQRPMVTIVINSRNHWPHHQLFTCNSLLKTHFFHRLISNLHVVAIVFHYWRRRSRVVRRKASPSFLFLVAFLFVVGKYQSEPDQSEPLQFFKRPSTDQSRMSLSTPLVA